MDQKIKGSLITDVFNLIGLTPYQSDEKIRDLRNQENHILNEEVTDDMAFLDELTTEQWERVIFDLEDELKRIKNFDCKTNPAFNMNQSNLNLLIL